MRTAGFGQTRLLSSSGGRKARSRSARRTSADATHPREARNLSVELGRVVEERLLEPDAALVGDLDSTGGGIRRGLVELLDHRPGLLEALRAELGPVTGQRGEHQRGVRRSREALHAKGNLDDELRRFGRRFADRPRPVGALAPGRPVEAEVRPDARWAVLTGEAVGGLEGDVAEEDVDLETLLHRLLFQERGLERLAEGRDHVEEYVIDHCEPRLPPSCAGGAFAW